jgi:hypothetical protein
VLHLLCVERYSNLYEYITITKLSSPNIKENFVKGLISKSIKFLRIAESFSHCRRSVSCDQGRFSEDCGAKSVLNGSAVCAVA